MKQYLKALIFGCTAITLSACQSAPDPLLVNAQVNASQLTAPVALTVNDMRSHNYLMRVKLSDDQAQFAPSEPLLETAVYEALANKIAVNSNANSTMQVAINEALIDVEQGSVKHVVEHQISLQVKVIRGDTTYTRDYNGKASSEGAFRADAAALESDFSALLSQLLSDVLNDEKLIALITATN